MATDDDQIKRLVAKPSEALNREVKRWLDPGNPRHQAKIVKAVMALRNRNGGQLLIGFDDKTLIPDQNAPASVRRVFNVDRIQQMISRYASEPFAIQIEFAERDGQEYPVVIVPAGVQVPVIIKRSLSDSGTELLKVGDVPFRTLLANGAFSTASAGPRDWREILDICFDNREADIGRFIRRHLPSLTAALSENPASQRMDASLKERTQRLLERGWMRYRHIKDRRGISAGAEERASEWGKWEVSAVIDPPVRGQVPNENFYNLLIGNNPQYTDWPSWPDTRQFRDEYARPNTREGGWEAFVVSAGSEMPWDFFTFIRMEADGQFYQLRALDDDALARARRGKPGSSLDPGLMITQVTEAIAVALRFAIALSCDPQTTKVGFAFRWRGLRERNLFAWSSRIIMTPNHYIADDDSAESFTIVPLDTSETALAPFVEEAISALFAKFHGYPVSGELVEARVQALLERKG